MIEVCNLNLRGTTLNLTPYKLVRDGDRGKNCIDMYLKYQHVQNCQQVTNRITQLLHKLHKLTDRQLLIVTKPDVNVNWNWNKT